MQVNNVVAIYLQVLAALLPPILAALAAWVARAFVEHLRSAQARAAAQSLVSWAEQTIPSNPERYARVSELLSREFPELSQQAAEVLIESSVQGLKAGLASAQAPAAAATAAAAAATAVVTGNGGAGGAAGAVGAGPSGVDAGSASGNGNGGSSALGSASSASERGAR